MTNAPLLIAVEFSRPRPTGALWRLFTLIFGAPKPRTVLLVAHRPKNPEAN